MIKLLKEQDDGIRYWEVWEHEGILYIHQGVIGETGSTEEVKVPLLKKAEKMMETYAEEKLNAGFSYLDEDELAEFVIQISYQENEDIEEVLNKRNFIEGLMNECLGWTGNGHCDGGDIGSGTANIFCCVIDIDKACEVIKKELEENNVLEGALLAYLDENEDYITLYPAGKEFKII